MTYNLSRAQPVIMLARVAAIVAFVAVVTVANAHDFWIIPSMFSAGPNATLELNGRQGGGKFPEGTAVPADRVTDARVIGASSTSTISEMAVVGTSLRLTHKPTSDGQYLIVVGLASRVNRQTPAGIIRFLKAEGGEAEALRLERENPFAGLDSVIFTSASYAATVAQVGNGGARAFGKTAGLALEFVAQNDPSRVRVGDTLHIKLLGHGAPLANLGLELASGLDVDAGSTENVERLTYFTDSKGIAHLPLTKAGPVMLRSAWASHRVGGAPNEWDVSRTTYVFNVGAGR